MALLSNSLSVWEIAFRWEGLDPESLWWRWHLPMTVRDWCRTMIHEIHHAHLECSSMDNRKWQPEDGEELRKFFIRYWLRQVEECSNGQSFDRQMLKWAHIERDAMQEWCERRGVPLPQFWFPPGWKLEYEWPDYEDDDRDPAEAEAAESAKGERRIHEDHRAKMACQQIALYFWGREATPSSIKVMAQRPEIKEFGGGSSYELETVAGWLGEVDPRDPSKKRGRKRRDNSGGALSDAA